MASQRGTSGGLFNVGAQMLRQKSQPFRAMEKNRRFGQAGAIDRSEQITLRRNMQMYFVYDRSGYSLRRFLFIVGRPREDCCSRESIQWDGRPPRRATEPLKVLVKRASALAASGPNG